MTFIRHNLFVLSSTHRTSYQWSVQHDISIQLTCVHCTSQHSHIHGHSAVVVSVSTAMSLTDAAVIPWTVGFSSQLSYIYGKLTFLFFSQCPWQLKCLIKGLIEAMTQVVTYVSCNIYFVLLILLCCFL